MSKRIREFCSFSEEEDALITEKARELGMSNSKLIEYATTLFIGEPRTTTPNVDEIRRRIEDYISQDGIDTFICSTPFADEWAAMTTSAKRTAASQMKKLVKEGLIEKLDPTSKAHQAAVYRKVGKENE